MMMPERIWAFRPKELNSGCWDAFEEDHATVYIRADIHAAAVEMLHKALEQALRYEEWVYSDENRCPELAKWLKENNK